jgi:hypothetical protein
MPPAAARARRAGTPPTCPVSASTPGWTNAHRCGLRRFAPPCYGGYAGSPRGHAVCDRPCGLHMPERRHRAWPPESSRARLRAVASGSLAVARHTTPLAGCSLRDGRHAARSFEGARGGAPPRGMTPVHTTRWPHIGHRSGWRSPRWAHTVCQSRPGGTSTGGCPRWARQTARASACVGWYSP